MPKFSKISLLVVAFLGLIAVAAPAFVYADQYGLEKTRRATGGLLPTSLAGATTIPQLIGKVVAVILSMLGIVFFLLILYGGGMWMIAMGNPERVTKGKEILEAAIIGLLIVLAAYAVSRFVFERLAPSGGAGGGGCASKTGKTPCLDAGCMWNYQSNTCGEIPGGGGGGNCTATAGNYCAVSCGPDESIDPYSTCSAGKLCCVGGAVGPPQPKCSDEPYASCMVPSSCNLETRIIIPGRACDLPDEICCGSGTAPSSGGPVPGATPTCTDGIKNQDETDVDCGGTTCPVRCAIGKGCDTKASCQPPADCFNLTCVAEMTCSDGIQNQDETGVDCGGTKCPACPTCSDSIKNQNESDVDCGGKCPLCDQQKSCNTFTDCASPYTCVNSKCDLGQRCADIGGTCSVSCAQVDTLTPQTPCPGSTYIICCKL